MEDKKDFWIAFTGHRPGKYFGYDVNDAKRIAIRGSLYQWLKSFKDTSGDKVRICTLTGGALGFDQDALAVCEELGFYNKVCVPCRGQENPWPDVSKRLYVALLQKASEIVYLAEKYEGPKTLLARNCFMVDNCTVLAAFWDGKREKGGTAHCVGYAEGTKNTPIVVIDPTTLLRSNLGDGWKFQTSLNFI